MYLVFKSLIPGVDVDSSSTTQKISGLKFRKYSLDMRLPNGVDMHFISFNRLFDKKELTINIWYVDEIKGKLLIDSWIKSEFE